MAQTLIFSTLSGKAVYSDSAIQRHGRKWRVQKRSNGQLRKWTFGTLQEAQRKRDVVFG